MTVRLTIRLDPDDRDLLETVAREQGKSLSALVRELVEAEARRVRRESIRAEGERLLAHLAEHPEARSELEKLDAPSSD